MNKHFKIKKLKYYIRILKKHQCIVFNIITIIVVLCLLLQNYHLKKEIQCDKANIYLLFNENNKIQSEISDLKRSIVSLGKISIIQDEKIEKSQRKK